MFPTGRLRVEIQSYRQDQVKLGDEGIFLARLTGPGKVRIQHITMPNPAGRLVPFLPFERSGGSKGINLNLG